MNINFGKYINKLKYIVVLKLENYFLNQLNKNLNYAILIYNNNKLINSFYIKILKSSFRFLKTELCAFKSKFPFKLLFNFIFI